MQLCTNLYTFMILWRIRKYKEAKNYIMICYESIRNIMSSEVVRGENNTTAAICKYSLYAIIMISMASVNIKLTGNIHGGIESIKKVLHRLQAMDLTVLDVIEKLITKLNRYSLNQSINSSYEFDPKAEVLEPQYEEPTSDFTDTYDWLLTKKFEMILYITTQINFITHQTPIIRKKAGSAGAPETMSRQTLIKLLAEPSFRFAKINEIDEAPFPASDTSVNSFFSSSLSAAPPRRSRNASVSISALSPSSRQAVPSLRQAGFTARSPKHDVIGGRL